MDGLCSLTAEKLSEEEQVFSGGPPVLHEDFDAIPTLRKDFIARNHPGYSAEDYCETEVPEPHMIKMPYPDNQNMKRLTHDIKFAQKKGIELKNNEFGKVWTNIQQKKAHADEDTKKMDQDLASKLKERSRKVDEDKETNELPPPPAFAQVQLRKTGSRELLNIE